jgi:hypothetical protein
VVSPLVLHADVQPPVPVEPGQPERVDDEIEVTTQRTMHGYARIVRWLVDEAYPHADYNRLVQDNLNTHTPAPLYETFPPA